MAANTSQNGFEFTIENEKLFAESLDRLGKATNDFRIPFRIISSDFYRSQNIIFNLKGPGLYNPLGGFRFAQVMPNGKTRRQNAEERKQKITGSAYPLLVGQTGDLADSTLSNKHRYSIFFLGKKELQIGTSVPYGKYHQSDKPRKKLPHRKFIFIDGGPNDASKSSGITGRRQRWINIVDTHTRQLVEGKI